MNNLYNKIYEAADRGVQKALIIDNNDISVKWHEKKKASDVNIMNHYVYNLLNENDNEYYYNQIVEYHNNTRYVYKCDSIDDLFLIFNKIKKFDKFPDIFKWIDTKNSLSFILENDNEITLSDYIDNPDPYMRRPVFMKISNPALREGNNDILIDSNYLLSRFNTQRTMQWQENSNSDQIQEDKYIIKDKKLANMDYSGYDTCQRIINNEYVKNETIKVPAIKYCMKLNKNGHRGYLPAMGQLRIISDYLTLINYVFKNILWGDYLKGNGWWSSTEESNYCAWRLYLEMTDNCTKQDGYMVLPLYTLQKYEIIDNE